MLLGYNVIMFNFIVLRLILAEFVGIYLLRVLRVDLTKTIFLRTVKRV